MANRAVITADIVNYTRLTKREQKKLLEEISTLLKDSKFDFYRGDSFNAYLKNPAEALKMALQLRAIARKYMKGAASPETDIRASIGIGQVDAPVRSLRTATGEAFTLSGRNLDNMTGSTQRLAVLSTDDLLNPALRAIGYFMDYLLSRLTSRQAEVVLALSKGLTQTEAAGRLHKSQATINQHVQSAGWPEMLKLLNEYAVITQKYK